MISILYFNLYIIILCQDKNITNQNVLSNVLYMKHLNKESWKGAFLWICLIWFQHETNLLKFSIYLHVKYRCSLHDSFSLFT